jgi:hypothetical protein
MRPPSCCDTVSSPVRISWRISSRSVERLVSSSSGLTVEQPAATAARPSAAMTPSLPEFLLVMPMLQLPEKLFVRPHEAPRIVDA